LTFLQAILLGILQGATEFLPVSSSGHLVLVPWLLGWRSPGLAFDAVVHWGTALAVIVYFWQDWLSIIRAVIGSAREQSLADPHARLGWLIVLGTLPAAIIGFLLDDFFEGMFGRPAAAAGFLLVTACLLAVTERIGRRKRHLETLGEADALTIGLAQACAIFPGISRSGATIAGGLTRRLTRESAARFSFLLATPIILAAGLFKLVDLAQGGALASQAPLLVIGFLVSAAVGWSCIRLLLQYVRRHPLYPFAIYCALFGLGSLIVFLVRGA